MFGHFHCLEKSTRKMASLIFFTYSVYKDIPTCSLCHFMAQALLWLNWYILTVNNLYQTQIWSFSLNCTFHQCCLWTALHLSYFCTNSWKQQAVCAVCNIYHSEPNLKITFGSKIYIVYFNGIKNFSKIHGNNICNCLN